MKIFEKYNFDVKGNIISKDDFRSLDFCKKESLVTERLDWVLKAADEDMERAIPHMTLSMYRAYHINGSTSAYGSPYRMRMAMALRLAFAYIRTADEKYFDKMLNILGGLFWQAACFFCVTKIT